MKEQSIDNKSLVPVFGKNRQIKENDTVTSNVAWFKLAEFIRRGEKERALSLYRLLTHSLADKSFLKKLEADIWFAFDQDQAQFFYEHAANLYKQDGKILQALMIFEQLSGQFPQNIHYHQRVIDLCQELGSFEKLLIWQEKYCRVLLDSGSLERSFSLFTTLQDRLKDAQIFLFHRLFVIAALKNHYAEQKIIKESLHRALEGLLRIGDQQTMQQFLSTLQGLNTLWYKDAVTYLEKQIEK